jgi:hypothetical protein
MTTADTSRVEAGPCLAWFGNAEDGVCLSYSNGNGVSVGTPEVGIFDNGGGIGVNTGPLLPGTTWNSPVPIS